MLSTMRWLAKGEHEVPEHLDWLVPAERARLDGLRFTKRRTEYLLRRWTAKQAVIAAVGLDSTTESFVRVTIGNHPTGAPYALVDGEPLEHDISVSDRAGWAVAMVGAAGPGRSSAVPAAVGIDLEIVEPRSDAFVTDFLTETEQAVVRALPDRTATDGAANLIWSAKEAALKVLRTGLRADTRTVEVTLVEGYSPTERDDGWSALAVRHTPTGRTFDGWWRRDGAFLLTLTSEAPLPEPPAVLVATSDLAAAVPTHSWITRPTAW